MVWAVSTGSVGSMAAGLMVMSTSSPWPFTRALTSPPPDVPSTSASASSCCALMRWSCICCAAASSCCRSIPPSGSTVPHLIESMAMRQCTALAGHPASAGFRLRGASPTACGSTASIPRVRPARGTPAWSPAVSSLRPTGDGGAHRLARQGGGGASAADRRLPALLQGRHRRLGFFNLLDDRAPELALDKLHAGRLGSATGGSRVVGPFLVVRSGRRGGGAGFLPARGPRLRRRRCVPADGAAALGGAARPVLGRLLTSRRRPPRCGAGRVAVPVRGIVPPVPGAARSTARTGPAAGPGRARRGSASAAARTAAGADDGPHPHGQPEHGAQHAGQHLIMAAGGEALCFALAIECDGEDAALQRVHRGRVEQHPGDPALPFHRLQHVRPVLAQRLGVHDAGAGRRGGTGRFPLGRGVFFGPGVLPCRGALPGLGAPWGLGAPLGWGAPLGLGIPLSPAAPLGLDARLGLGVSPGPGAPLSLGVSLSPGVAPVWDRTGRSRLRRLPAWCCWGSRRG